MKLRLRQGQNAGNLLGRIDADRIVSLRMFEDSAGSVGEKIDVTQALDDISFFRVGRIGDPYRPSAFHMEVALGGAPLFLKGGARFIVHLEAQGFLEQHPDCNQEHAKKQDVAEGKPEAQTAK